MTAAASFEGLDTDDSKTIEWAEMLTAMESQENKEDIRNNATDKIAGIDEAGQYELKQACYDVVNAIDPLIKADR